MASPIPWFEYARRTLELLYYLSGFVIAIAAVLGLRQLTITREIARVNAKRESYKLAADECRNFAEIVVPSQTRLERQLQGKNFQTFANRHFVLERGEIKSHNFDLVLLHKELGGIENDLVAFLNTMEAFAIFFASGVAAEEIGFRETGTAFCVAVERYMPGIAWMRSFNIRYESTIKLYEIWHARQVTEKISTQIEELQDAANRLPKETIKPIGT